MFEFVQWGRLWPLCSPMKPLEEAGGPFPVQPPQVAVALLELRLSAWPATATLCLVVRISAVHSLPELRGQTEPHAQAQSHVRDEALRCG